MKRRRNKLTLGVFFGNRKVPRRVSAFTFNMYGSRSKHLMWSKRIASAGL